MSLLLLAPPAVALLYFLVGPFLSLLFRQSRSPLRHLPGPPSPSFFMGNLADMHDQENNNLLARWERQYGHSFVYRGFIGGCRLMTTDPVAVAHILAHAYDYPKPDFVRDSLATMVAGHDGLLTVEGDHHRRQRKILSPAFTSTHIKSLAPIFWSKAIHLRDIWLAQADAAPSHSTRIDALAWLARATLDVIGLAGFGYSFNSLTHTDNELADAFSTIFSTARKFRVITILQVWFPVLRRFRRNNAAMADANATMRRIGIQLIDQKRNDIASEKSTTSDIDGDKTTLGRDLLSVLIRSNNASASSQQMSTNEVLCQISTFIAAGHETTASALTWCLYALGRDPHVQNRLREALREIAVDGAGAGKEEWDDQLVDRVGRCDYLDWVVREALRVHAPVTNTMRVCMRDVDEIPVRRGDAKKGQDEGGYTDKYGVRQWTIRVKRGDIISIPIQAINKSKDLWGEDALEFRPERWATPPASARAIPGLYAHTLTFLNGNPSPTGGNRACIGWRFALLEIKIFLYVLLRDIEFGMDPSLVVEKKVK
ncbi:cytochrome P450 [Collybia nuda]|uniref:Cytochrome P450 n=1 Tax=Collybia nuda TaxID=64659 RepID=A0A9P6CI65_9AGAR|nr:cytochrome P450 [Collybia nuda]